MKSPLEADPRFARRLPRIFVGVCAFGDIPHEAFQSFMLWWGQTCANYKGHFELHFGISPRKEQYRARNGLVTAAERQGADFLLMLDDDQMPHLCPDMLGKFWALGKPVMGGLYYQRGGCYHPVAMKEFPGPMGKRPYRFLLPSEIEDKPFKVDVAGHGCMWVDMNVYARMKQHHHWPFPEEVVFVPFEDMGLDVHFCQRVRDDGGEIWLHPGIHIGHLRHSHDSIDYRTRPPQEVIEKSPDWANYWQTIYSLTKDEAAITEHDKHSAA